MHLALFALKQTSKPYQWTLSAPIQVFSAPESSSESDSQTTDSNYTSSSFTPEQNNHFCVTGPAPSGSNVWPTGTPGDTDTILIELWFHQSSILSTQVCYVNDHVRYLVYQWVKNELNFPGDVWYENFLIMLIASKTNCMIFYCMIV